MQRESEDKDMISKDVRNMIPKMQEFFRNQPIKKAWLFGSCSRGEETADSDVDILVTLDKSRPIGLKFFGMVNDIERMLGRKVDLVSDAALQPFAHETVERDKILIYERSL